MPDQFDGYQYWTHLRSRWRLTAIVIGMAVATSLAISLLLPKKYTARAALLIEPPAGSDTRVSTAFSPIYLESLKTYEHFASSDHLFAQAVERFHLREGRSKRSIEGLKRDVLKVEIPRNTKIMEIAVTLPDPHKAHAAAVYIAEETIKLNRKTNRAGDDEMIEEARKSAQEAAQRLEAVESTRSRFQRRAPSVEALKAELEQLRVMREEVDRLALSAELAIAERGDPSAASANESRLQSAGSRAARLRREASDLNRQISTRQQALVERTAEADRLEAEYESAWTARDQLEKRLRELQGTIGYRGERLSLVDPGVAPERPSSPNIPLNLLVAAALGLIASLSYLTVNFSLESHQAETLRKTLRVAAKT